MPTLVHFRPTEVDLHLLGDASKARRLLGWQHRISFKSLVSEMVRPTRLGENGHSVVGPKAWWRGAFPEVAD